MNEIFALDENLLKESYNCTKCMEYTKETIGSELLNVLCSIQNATSDIWYDLGAMLSTDHHITPIRYRRMLKYV